MSKPNRSTQAVIEASACSHCGVGPGFGCVDGDHKPLERNVHAARMLCPLCGQSYAERSGTGYRHEGSGWCRLMSIERPRLPAFSKEIPAKISGSKRGRCEVCRERKEVWGFIYNRAASIRRAEICMRCAGLCGMGSRWKLDGKLPNAPIVPTTCADMVPVADEPDRDEDVARHEVEKLPAGKPLDMLVAELVMEAVPIPASSPPFSTEISAAWMIVDKLRADGINLWSLGETNQQGELPWQADFGRDFSSDKFAFAETPALAICRAALLCVKK